jgi:hypothetical protein
MPCSARDSIAGRPRRSIREDRDFLTRRRPIPCRCTTPYRGRPTQRRGPPTGGQAGPACAQGPSMLPYIISYALHKLFSRQEAFSGPGSVAHARHAPCSTAALPRARRVARAAPFSRHSRALARDAARRGRAALRAARREGRRAAAAAAAAATHSLGRRRVVLHCIILCYIFLIMLL